MLGKVNHGFALYIYLLLATIGFNSCSRDCEVCPPPAKIQNVTIAAAEYGAFCATYYAGGDYDFSGHGPNVYFEAEVYVSGDSLMFSFMVDAIETEANWTRGAGRWDRLLYRVPEGFAITAVDTPVACDTSYTDVNHAIDFIDCGDIRIRGYGDCDGHDVGTACLCTRYWVWIRGLNVEITKEE